MPMFMDRHLEPEEALPTDIAEAHLKDLEVQEKYGVRYLTYWVDFERHSSFCLVDAPDSEAAAAVHREACGVVANEIIPVDPAAVRAFLGRLTDPPGVRTNEGQPILESAFRTILFTDIEGSTALTQRLGDEAAMHFIKTHNEVVRDALKVSAGSEVKHTGDGIMASFASVSRGVECAINIQRSLLRLADEKPAAAVRVRMGLSAGEPVQEDGDLFGAAVQLARRICDAAEPGCILSSNVVKELCIGKTYQFADRGEFVAKGIEEPVRVYEVSWREH